MKTKLLSLLLAVGMMLGLVAACDSNGNDKPPKGPDPIDYAAQVTLDMNSETLKQEVTVETHIDGDTTHFNVPRDLVATGLLKARYLAVNTPESTGQIEEWGKKASNYTKNALKSAKSIIIETNGTEWEVDSTGERYLVWVWYKSADMPDYRCLNIELLQEGLAVGSKASDTRYGEICVKAIDQATVLELNVHSSLPDPDYFYADAYAIDLRELRLNKDKYVGARVAFEGVITQNSDNGIYVENYDEETKLSYGVYAYYGFGLPSAGERLLVVGNRVRIVGDFTYSETFGYQISNLKYDPYDKGNPDHISLIEKNVEVPCKQVSPQLFVEQNKTITFMQEQEDGEAVQVSKTMPFAELALNTHVSFTNLVVEKAYTTSNGGDSDGAMTLTCKANGETIVLRTEILYNADASVVVQSQLVGKTIDVKGIIDQYNGQYQIQVFLFEDITIH